MKSILIGIVAAGLLVIGAADVQAHAAFKKVMSQKYPDMKVSCNACHVKGKGKSQRNDFGKLFFKELKTKKLTAGFKSKQGDERKKYANDVMVPAFTAALKKVKKLKPKDSEMSYDELIKAGKMADITKKEVAADGSEKKEGSENKGSETKEGSEKKGSDSKPGSDKKN